MLIWMLPRAAPWATPQVRAAIFVEGESAVVLWLLAWMRDSMRYVSVAYSITTFRSEIMKLVSGALA